MLLRPFLSSITAISRRPALFIHPSPIPCYRLIPSVQWHLPRFQSNLQKKDPTDKKPISAEVFEKMQVIKRRIPGERDQTNSVQDRFPSSWHFEQEAVPTLLPRPGVPEPNKLALAKMYQLLKLKKEPELIYEAEPHKLYFVFCYAFAFVFIIYAVNALSIGWDLTNRMFESNDNNLAGWKLDLEYVMHAVIVVVLGCLPLGIGFGFLGLPTRLIRRIWYLPAGAGRQAYVRFTTHPLLPNRPTPVRTMPIGTLQKSISAKIYSGKGFYGVNDSSFFFFLRENGKRIPFIADRKGFFWGDGRLFDLIFSNDTVDEVENSKKIDEAYGDMLKERRSKEQEMKKQYGFGWRTKAAGKLMIDDVTKIKDMLTEESEVAVRDEPQRETEKVTKRDRKKAASKKVAQKPSKHAQSRKADSSQGGSKENHRL